MYEEKGKSDHKAGERTINNLGAARIALIAGRTIETTSILMKRIVLSTANVANFSQFYK